MIDEGLLRCLEPVARRIWHARLWATLALIWFASAAIGVVLLVLRSRGVWHGDLLAVFGLGVILAVVASVWIVRQSLGDYQWVAHRLEAAYPDLDSSLLTAIEQRPAADGRYGYLQHEIFQKVFLHADLQPWSQLVPTPRLVAVQAAHFAGLVTLAAVVAGFFFLTPSSVSGPHSLAFDDVAVVTNREFSCAVEPGNADVERGSSLLVLARFGGQLPSEARLVYQVEHDAEQRQTMSKSLDDPVFGARVAEIDQPLTYYVEYDAQVSDVYRVTVFEYPRLERADARLRFPRYTNLDDKLVQDVRRLSAVEGTEVTWECYLNKPVAEARLDDEDGFQIELTANSSDPLLYRAAMQLTQSRRMRLQLVDAEGRPNRTPPELVIDVLPNRPADIKLVLPARDVSVSPIEELDLQASAWDDFGLARAGLNYALAGGPSQDIVLGEALPAREQVLIEHLLSFEEMRAQPDQLVAYYFWAEDIGPDGVIRRTAGDMYFAEVRHFEEIFRQGQQPSAGQMQQQQQQGQPGGPNAQEAERLAELQKQIVSGTWKVIRRETRDEPSPEFSQDVQLLLESQLSALEQAVALAERIQDEQSLQQVEEVQQHMQRAVTQLEQAREESARDGLQPALASEQSAYQALLRLRAREQEVVRSDRQQSSQSSGSPSSASSRRQQQLQQLELRDDENRYETEQTAPPQETEGQREDRQVLNRLRELARRQDDLNQRVKQLQSALEEAQKPDEREEIQRQLKRLRDEQQQILRDTEELEQRMEQPQNQQRMSQDRQRLQQARENARQASEALEQGQVSRAASEGTRAERELRELRNEFQRRTSGQFTEQVRQMQRQARELQQQQQEIAEQLDQLDRAAERPSLRDSNDRQPIAERLQQQQQRVEDLLERMRQTVEEAEQSEPLMAEQLYDAIREARQQDPQSALDSARRSLERGLLQDARQQEREARDGISQLREGIDRAAENVVGDEIEALRRAQAELEQLSRELTGEIARAEPGTDPQPSDRSNNQAEGSPAASGRRPDAPGQDENPDQRGAESDQRGPRDGQRRGESPSDQPAAKNPSRIPRASDSQPGGQPGGRQQPPDGAPNQETPNQDNPNQETPNQDNQSSPASPGQGQSPRGGRQPAGQRGLRGADDRNPAAGGGGLDQFLERGDDRPVAPLTGQDYLDWSDRLRDVEEMLSDPELRAEAARIRDRAKAVRKDVKRHSQPPNWDVVREMVAEPLVALQRRVSEELLRQTSKDALVPIDRDPVPAKYEAQVRRYYERLGTGQ